MIVFRSILLVGSLLFVAACLPTFAQQRTTGAAPLVTQPTSKATAPVSAPQINPVIQRISGLKILHFLRRSGVRVAPLSDETLTTDAIQTSITAGLSLEDGSVVARLPRPETESSATPVASPSETSASSQPQAPANLSVLLRDGKERALKFIGVDGGTGLSLLQPSEQVGLTATRDAKEDSLTKGQRVRLLSPNRAPQVAGITSSEIYVDVTENIGSLSRISRSSTGGVTRLTFKGENLSASLLGAIAVNDSGETIGFIDAINGNEAEAIPIAGVRRAVERIRQRVANKPRPWLGARGTSVVALSREQLEGIGWKPAQVTNLQANQVGVLLTSVASQTPASLAKLRVGDVVVGVNGNEVRSAEEFSSLLSQTSEKESVQFTVISTDRTTPRLIAVTLIWTLDPVIEMEAAEERATRLKSSDPLVARGIETLPITAALASRLKARGGRFVVFVHPSSPASRAGMLAGDVVESVNSRLISESTLPTPLKDKITIDVVRNGQKLEFQIETEKSSSSRTDHQ